MTDIKTPAKPDRQLGVGDILLKGNYVSAEDIQKAQDWAETNKASVEEYLLGQGLITKDLLGQAVAEFYKVPYADLNTKIPSKEQVLKIPQDLALNFRLVLFAEDKSGVVITSDHPTQINQIKTQLETIFPEKKISPAYSLPEDIDACFIHYRAGTRRCRIGAVYFKSGG